MTLIGTGENEMAMVYVEDAVRALVLAGSCPGAAGTTLIAGNTERVTQRQYFDALADGFGIPRVTRKVNYSVAFVAGWVGEYLFKDGIRAAAVRRSAIALTGLPQRINSDYTQKLLGWKPTTKFDDGMRAAFQWYHREYAAKVVPGK
jgi:nucleoside-diphosphate-sugar epimerase